VAAPFPQFLQAFRAGARTIGFEEAKVRGFVLKVYFFSEPKFPELNFPSTNKARKASAEFSRTHQFPGPQTNDEKQHRVPGKHSAATWGL
jgi:hypothetical protein